LNTNQIRNQHKIKLFYFQEIKDSHGQLIAPEDFERTITVSDSIYLYQLKLVIAQHNPSTSLTDVVFMLKADNVDEDDPQQLQLFERVLREGIYFKGEKYVRSIKSPAMGRTQRTEFIQEKYIEELYNRISLGHFPTLTNINKWEAALGVSRSTAMSVPYIPRIVVIPDYDKPEIIEDVWKVVTCAEDSEQQKLVLAEKNQQRDYFKAKKEIKPSQEHLQSLKPIPNKEIIIYSEVESIPDQTDFKTMNGWNKEHCRVKIDQIPFPVHSAEYYGELHPCYSIEQTEEIPIIEINEESIGLKRVEIPQYINKDVPFFDGQGLMSFEFAECIGQHLGLSYPPNAIQGRLPYIKGNFIRFDIHKWLENIGVLEIIDVFGESQPIVDQQGRTIDLILTKSCFKAWHTYVVDNPKPKCLFKSMAEYEQLLTKYHHDSFWVANYAKPAYQIKPYTPFTYQYIHALNLTYEDLLELKEPLMDVIRHVLYGKKDDSDKWFRDIAYTKTFLNMLAQEDEAKKDDHTEELDDTENGDKSVQQKKFVSEIIDAIDFNELMIYDGNVRKFIVKQAMLKVQEIMKGRIPVRGSYYYLTNDPIAFMQHATGQQVKGELRQNQAYMKNKVGTHALFRSPLTIFNEVAKVEFINIHNPYISHLDNIIILNCHDLTLTRMGGADVDGDTALCTNEPIILNAVIDVPAIINEGDKYIADPVPNNIDSIIAMELKSLHNLTGRCTNVNSFFQNQALEEGDIQSRLLENTVLKYLQGQIIDATKNGLDVEIPYVLDKFAAKMPYFFRFINGGSRTDYQYSTKTPFNRFCMAAEEYIEEKFNQSNGKMPHSVYKIDSTKQILQDFDKVSQANFLEYIKLVEPLYKEYNKEKSEIDRMSKKFNGLKKWERDNDTRKEISEGYKKLREKYLSKCEAICPFPSILATVAVEIAYQNNKTYGFAWLFVDGLLENLKKHENVVKKEVLRVQRLTNREVVAEQLEVKDEIARVGEISFELKMSDGKYRLFELMGQYYISHDVIRETEIEVSNTPALSDRRSTRKALRNYPISLSLIRGSKDETESIETIVDNVIGKRLRIQVVDKQFIHIVDENNQVKCCVPRNQWINETEKFSLLDFDSAEIEIVDISKTYQNSFKATVHIA
jgi:hypothetical protein